MSLSAVAAILSSGTSLLLVLSVVRLVPRPVRASRVSVVLVVRMNISKMTRACCPAPTVRSSIRGGVVVLLSCLWLV